MTCESGSCTPTVIEFSVTPYQSEYDYSPAMFEDGTVKFRVSFVNYDHANQLTRTISAHGPTNLSIVSLTRDGIPLVPTLADVTFRVSQRAVAQWQLTTIGYFQGTFFDTGLATYYKQGGADIGVVFTAPGPGLYSVVFQYHYSGPDNGNPNVFHGVLNQNNAVTFRVR